MSFYGQSDFQTLAWALSSLSPTSCMVVVLSIVFKFYLIPNYSATPLRWKLAFLLPVLSSVPVSMTSLCRLTLRH